MLHGIARTTLLTPRIGKERAIKLSALTGTLLALAICFALVPAINLPSAQAHLILGVFLAAFMAAFDIAVGRWLMRKAWAKIWPDFNPATGNYLLFGLLLPLAAPFQRARQRHPSRVPAQGAGPLPVHRQESA